MDRPIRGCDVCGQEDDHPRHVIGDVSVRHMDCCLSMGCEVCADTELENEGRRGEDLVAHLVSLRAA